MFVVSEEDNLTFIDILTYTADNQPLRPHMVVSSTSKLLVLSPLVLITPYSDVTVLLHYICWHHLSQTVTSST